MSAARSSIGDGNEVTKLLSICGLSQRQLQAARKTDAVIRHTPVAYIFGAGRLAHSYAQSVEAVQGARPILVVDDTYLSSATSSGYEVVGFRSLGVIAREIDFVLCGILNRNFEFEVARGAFAQMGISLLHSSAIRGIQTEIPNHATWTIDYTLAESSRFLWLDEVMADDRSRRVLRGHIAFRISGDPARVSQLDTNPYLLNLPSNSSSGGAFIDVGAYVGDTLSSVLAHVGEQLHAIVCVEPDPINFRELSRTAEELAPKYPRVQIQLRNQAVHSESGWCAFECEGDESSKVLVHKTLGDGESVTMVSAVTLEELAVAAEGHLPLTIKMDVEGHELASLRSSWPSLPRDNVTYAVSAYHRESDLLDLAEVLSSTTPTPKLRLRQHGRDGTDLVLYASFD